MVKDKKVTESLFLFILVSLSLIFFAPFLLNPHFLTIKDNDLGRTYIPLFSFIRDSFYSYKSLPLWRPDQLMGEPFIGNPLSALLYPGIVFFLILPINFASVVFYFCHFSLAAIFTHFLARSFNFSKLSSFAAAIFYAFSTKMLLHTSAGHITMIVAFSYFPLVFLAVRKVLQRPTFAWIVVGSIALAFMLATYPTIFYYAIIFMVIYILYYYLTHTRYPKKYGLYFFSIRAVSLFLIFVISLALSAIYLLPQLEFAPLSTRSSLTLQDVAIPLWNKSLFVQSLILPYWQLKRFDQESFLYLGLVPTILMIIGFFHLKKSQKIFLLIFGFLALLFVAGLSTPVFPIAYKFLPFLKYSRVTTRAWFVPILIVSLISASILDKIKNRKFVYIVVSIFLVESFFIGYAKIFSTKDLVFSNKPLYLFLKSDAEAFRVYCTSYCFNPQFVSRYKIQVLHGETPIQNAKFLDFLQKAGGYSFQKFTVIFPPYQIWQTENSPQPSAYYLGLANVKYVTSTYPVTASNFEFINKFDDIYLYKNTLFRKRIYFENSTDAVNLERYSPNSIIVSFRPSEHARNLIFAENYYPGWFVYQNQQKFNVEKKEPIFRKVIVYPNTNRLELKYQPESFTFGKTITISSILFLLTYFWYISLRHRRI